MRSLAVAVVFLVAGCGRPEKPARHESGLVLSLPADWVESPGDGHTSWSGARGTQEWRTTINLHAVPVATDEVTRSVDGVAEALVAQYRRMGGKTRLSRGQRLAGREAVRLDVRFEHGGTPYRRLQLVTRRGDHIVHLDATAPAALWDRLQPILERAVDTARWEDT